MDKPQAEARVQLDFYARQADGFVDVPFGPCEADFALPFVVGQIRMRGYESMLDVGAGMGRALALIGRHAPLKRMVGLEPSAEMRALARRHYGFSEENFVDGDATALPFADREFDVVAEFATLHHVRQPRLALQEMIRVARHAVVVADVNNLGQGSKPVRRIKQMMKALGLWRAFDLLRTRGRGYQITESDGLWYSYSLFNDIDLLRAAFETVHVVNATGSSLDHYRDAPGGMIFAFNRRN